MFPHYSFFPLPVIRPSIGSVLFWMALEKTVFFAFYISLSITPVA
jgi:hypothetical protein